MKYFFIFFTLLLFCTTPIASAKLYGATFADDIPSHTRLIITDQKGYTRYKGIVANTFDNLKFEEGDYQFSFTLSDGTHKVVDQYIDSDTEITLEEDKDIIMPMMSGIELLAIVKIFSTMIFIAQQIIERYSA